MKTKTSEEWRRDAACRGLAERDGNFDLFYEPAYERQAKRVCRECTVRADCLQWALREGQWEAYVLGGMNPQERSRAYRRFLHWSNRHGRSDAAWQRWSREATDEVAS